MHACVALTTLLQQVTLGVGLMPHVAKQIRRCARLPSPAARLAGIGLSALEWRGLRTQYSTEHTHHRTTDVES